MNILVNGYVGKKITGIGRTLLETIEHICKIDNNIRFVMYTNYDNYDFLNYKWPSNIVIRKIPVSKNSSILNLLYNMFVFPFKTIKEKADIIYYPNFAPIFFNFSPIVCVIHDLIEFKIKNKFSPLRVFYRKIIVPRMAKKSKIIITVSENSKKDIIELLKQNPNKIKVVYNGVSDNFKSLEKGNRIFNFNYMLFVGTVDYPGKNIFNAITAFEAFKNETKENLKFIICGMKGKGFDVIDEKINTSPYKEDILYLGYVEDDKLKIIYNYAKIFIFISYYEGFGLPILEAMKLGVPVITSNRSSLPEVAGNAAIIVDPDDVISIKEAIKNLYYNEELSNELKTKGYENVAKYSWQKTAEKTLDIFYSIYK